MPPAPTSPHIAALYRYPVKGLSPEQLAQVTVAAGETIPGDRAYAIENGSTDFDPAAPRYFPKIKFLMLMKQARLAQLHTSFDADSHVLTIRPAKEAAPLLTACLATADGRAATEAFFQTYMPQDLRGPPRVVYGKGHSFSDVAMKCLSLINLASLRDLEARTGHSLHPLRFRANVYLEGLAPWCEMDWIGRAIALGTAGLTVAKTTVRCAATQVNPLTGERDIDVPRLLQAHYGHQILGVYAVVTRAGTLKEGDPLRVLDQP